MVGVAVGAAAYLMNSQSSSMRRTSRQIKRNTGRALRQVGEFIGNVSYMIK
jgi:gas vesicle protein